MHENREEPSVQASPLRSTLFSQFFPANSLTLFGEKVMLMMISDHAGPALLVVIEEVKI